MITITDAISWLNQFEPTHLRRPPQALLRHITNLQTAEDKRRQMINSVIKNSRGYRDKLELPELLINIAGLKYRQANYATAKDYASAAVQLFPEESHAQAVARWVLGMVAWKLSDARLGYSSWYYAREIFQVLAEKSGNEGNTQANEWYTEKLTAMNIDMVCTPEETYAWLDLFEPSHLSKAAKQINDAILSRMENNQFQDAYKLIEDMKTLGRNSEDHIEEAEVLVECGLAVFHMGNVNEAVRLLQGALSKFTEESHHQAICRWLLGVVQWESPEKHNQAIMNWERCLEQIQDLAARSDQQNRQARRKWYEARREIMTEALNQKIKERLDA